MWLHLIARFAQVKMIIICQAKWVGPLKADSNGRWVTKTHNYKVILKEITIMSLLVQTSNHNHVKIPGQKKKSCEDSDGE